MTLGTLHVTARFFRFLQDGGTVVPTVVQSSLVVQFVIIRELQPSQFPKLAENITV